MVFVLPCIVAFGTVPAIGHADNPQIYIPDPILIPCALTAQQVRAVIHEGVSGRDWESRDAGDGAVEARLLKGKYTVTVTITFGAREVHIVYLDSENLEYRGSGAAATIKKGYNGWIRNIEKDIAVRLSRHCG